MTSSRPNGLIRVLGIDPGSVVTGYGLIESDGARSFHLTHGHIRVKGDSFAQRLGHIHSALGEVITEWQPQEVAIEQVFLSNNAMSALKLGQARGAAITAAVTMPGAHIGTITRHSTARSEAPSVRAASSISLGRSSM